MKFGTTLAASMAGLAMLVVASAHGQGAPAAPAMPTIPPMQCEKPGNPPLDQQQMLRFGKRVDEYKLCVNEYARQMGTKGNEYADIARAYTNAANGAVDQYNEYVKDLNEKTSKK
jgi:hypothetical protein